MKPEGSSINRISGKSGTYRKYILGKRNKYCGKAVIAPDPNIKIDEVGILASFCYDVKVRTESISTLPQKGRLSKCALKGSKHALNFFRVALPHRYLAYWLFNLAYYQEYF
jgi:hypothetical protein